MGRAGVKVIKLHQHSRARPLKNPGIDPKEWRAEFRAALSLFNGDEERMHELGKRLQKGVSSRAWAEFLDASGKPFTHFNDFCRHPQPQGLACEPEDVRQLLCRLFGERRAKLLTVSASRQGQRTSPPGEGKSSRNDERLRAILRAPEEVQDLVVEGLLTEKEGQRFGVLAPSPALARRIRMFSKKAKSWLSTLEADETLRKDLRSTARDAARKTFLGVRPKEVYSAMTGANSDLFPQVIALHVPERSRVIDLTYGMGVFWKQIPAGTYQLTKCDLQSGTDLKDLPFDDGAFDAAILDPPYSSRSDSPSSFYRDHEERYQNVAQGAKGHEEVLSLYVDGAKEALRVLTDKGVLIVKTQGEVSNGKQYLTHYEIYEAYKRIGWFICDEFVLVQAGKLPNPSRQRQQFHARKNHSLFLVFRRSTKRRR